MKVALISPYGGINNLGLRSLSACLKKENHQVRLIFLPRRRGKNGDFDDIFSLYDGCLLEEIYRLCRDVDLVGISVMTSYFFLAAQLTKSLKSKIKAPVIWGGIHPTVEPEDCLKYADGVCLGEGEEAIVEMVGKMKKGYLAENVRNFWLKTEDKIIKNPLNPLKQDLNSLPFPDYKLENHFILHRDRLVRLRNDLFEKYLPRLKTAEGQSLPAYSIFATRGCPHSCSYCCNNALKKLYPDQKYIRRRSVENIVEELEIAIKQHPFIKAVRIEDDSFLVASTSDIAKFAKEYRKKIGLPFICLSSPVNINEDKIKSLVEAGMIGIQMGIQSGSDSLNTEIYGRPIKEKIVLRAATIINRYEDRMNPPRYDIITDNPFEKKKDLIATIRLLAKISGRYILNYYSLVFYPGTDLYVKAEKEGLMKNKAKVYLKDWLAVRMTYLKFLIFLNRFSFFKVPQSWLKFLLNKRVVRIGERFDFAFNLSYRFVYWLRPKLPF